MPVFTVFTPTYNRSHTLGRVYDSLRAQTVRNFEWLVIDDGSTDGTADLIANWMKTADFPIRYFFQANAGKHIAHNFAIREAHGTLFCPLDSDDAIVPETLATLHRRWLDIPEIARGGYAGVWCLCGDRNGKIVGDSFPQSPFDADLRDVEFVHRNRGEKWCMLRTDVLRQFPFPEIAGTSFVPEGMIWMSISAQYTIRCVNDVLRIYYVDGEGDTPTLSNSAVSDNAPGRLCYYLWLLNNNFRYIRHSPKPFLKAALMLPVVARYAGRSFRDAWAELTDRRARLLVAMTYPLSVPLALYYRAKGY
jgi:glycosyltransferase involved in cell wall biosynthesis